MDNQIGKEVARGVPPAPYHHTQNKKIPLMKSNLDSPAGPFEDGKGALLCD